MIAIEEIQKFLRIDWLCNMQVNTGLDRAALVLVTVITSDGNHEWSFVAMNAANPAGNLQTIFDARQAEIQQDHIWIDLFDQLDRIGTIAGYIRLVSHQTQEHRQGVCSVKLVLDHQNTYMLPLIAFALNHCCCRRHLLILESDATIIVLSKPADAP